MIREELLDCRSNQAGAAVKARLPSGALESDSNFNGVMKYLSNRHSLSIRNQRSWQHMTLLLDVKDSLFGSVRSFLRQLILADWTSNHTLLLDPALVRKRAGSN